ncbi:uncharacterized protein LOC143256562 [Tachypleus tridentatus]|uniref:uncharacterized protein LOC143256562 n=1 Tax=Tachypleus tridentatus TaxID=6853 RepID=UPI003FD66D89
MNPLVDQYISKRPSMNFNWINSNLPFHEARMTWSKEENILDFGCGPGTITRNILLPQCVNLKKLIGVNIQPVFVEYAKKTFNHEKIEYREINIMERIPSEWEGLYHKIFSLFFYSLCQRYLKTFKGISPFIETRWVFSCSGYMYRRIVKQFKRYVKTAAVD